MQRRVALITGAGRGIGQAVAVELAQRGFDVALVARTIGQIEQTARNLTEGTRVRLLPGDVTDPAVVHNVVDQCASQLERIDALVHCAGVAPVASLEMTSLALWKQTIDTNLTAAYLLAQRAWKHLCASRGAIVNLSSEAARDPFPGFLAYASAKAGVNMLGLMLHREGQPHGVRCYTVAPGAVETEMLRKILCRRDLPTEQTLAPADVARTVAACIEGDLRHASGEVIYLHR
jgi:NAD(P)-dependent dehydrogenase (short-subunit alcohol dehydrogenase family)